MGYIRTAEDDAATDAMLQRYWDALPENGADAGREVCMNFPHSAWSCPTTCRVIWVQDAPTCHACGVELITRWEVDAGSCKWCAPTPPPIRTVSPSHKHTRSGWVYCTWRCSEERIALDGSCSGCYRDVDVRS